MASLIRDSTLGSIVRILTRNRFLTYPEESGSFEFRPEKFQNTRDAEKSKLKADLETGNLVSPEVDQGLSGSEISNDADGILVGWYGLDDPENPLNWSSGRKVWVTLLIS
jgi:MFS transporter, DHA1 family, multidrug resistance protein